MPETPLFPPTPTERLAIVALFVSEERSHRVFMLGKYPDGAGQVRYWQKRVTQCDEALAHIACLAEAVGR